MTAANGMPVRHLVALRSWRTWLFAGCAMVQGAQYFARPLLPLTTAAFAPLNSWGPHGWQTFGVLLMVVGAWVSLVSGEWSLLGHLGGALLYGVLAVASFRAGIIPAVLLLPFGLCVGEIGAWAGQVISRPGWGSTRRRGE